MDRRKLGSRNVLHKQLYSSSQTAASKPAEPEPANSIPRSKSAQENLIPPHQQTARKRKNPDELPSRMSSDSSPVRPSNNRTKKRRNVVQDDSSDDAAEVKEVEPSPKKPSPSFAKPRDTRKRPPSNNSSDKDEDIEHHSGSSGSVGRASTVRDMLKALDKSPSKLSQSSNSSVDKYRKVNLRTPIRARLQRSSSKAIAEKKNAGDKQSHNGDPRLRRANVAGPASKKNAAPVVDEISNGSGSDNEMSFSDTDAPPKKAAKKGKVESPKKVAQASTSRVSPVKTQRSPEKRKRVVESPELSPLKDFPSPEKSNVNVQRRRICNESDDKFVNFLTEAGVTLSSSDSFHSASDDPRAVVLKMQELLTSGDTDIDDIVRAWNAHIEDEENLKKSLSELKIENDEGVAVCSKATSLSRLLLEVPQLQIRILNGLVKKLIDAVITTDSSDDAPWALQMLQQFRFLEIIVDSEVLISRIEELLSSSPEWFQREVIVFIPDIVTDVQHRTTAEMLIKIMERNSDLTNIILDCIHNLILGKEYREELRDQVLGLLEKGSDKSTVPAIARFILTSCATEAVASKSLNALRAIDMSPTSKESVDECYTSQVFMVNAIKTSIQLFKEVTQAAVTIVKTMASEAVPMDIVIAILLYETTAAKKKIVEAALHGHIKDGYYRVSLLNALYSGYKQVAKSFQSTALNLAINLLKADSPAHVEFGIEWLRNMFISQSDTSYKQREIMERLLNLMGSKDKTVKNALEVLCRMANDESERRYLQQHACFLRSFLEKIDNLQFDEVTTLYHLLHGLCTHSELISNILNDDLTIIMQKQLCSSKVVTKCKGVLGAVMAIKHLAGSAETSEQAYELLKKTLSSIKACPRSQSLFYDQLGQVIATTLDIDDEFLSNITAYFEDDFVANCLVETQPDGNLVPRYCLNDPAECSYYVNFGSGKTGAFVPVFFKLLRICNLRLSGSLESINAVLGAAILMPDDIDLPEPSTADYMIHCINFFRELIGGFVTQEEDLLRKQVLKRLDTLMALQGEFVTMVAMCESRYQPPPCYFHHFPVPQFVRVEVKVPKKGKGKGKKKDKQEDPVDSTLNKTSIMLPEWENWEIGSELTVKNPAFFRQLDTKIIHLLDANMDMNSSQPSDGHITIAQVCFIVKELLGMFENQASESFVRDLIQLLPKICAKLKKIIADLREHDSSHEKEAVRLLLCLLVTIFSWKEFQGARYNTLLRDGLRTLAGMMSESSALLRTCKDLVGEAYKYFESLADIATQISLAVTLVNMCGCLMKHSTSFTEHCKDRQAKMAYGFLCLEWNNETNGAQYKAAVKELLKTWIDNEPDPLKTIRSVVEWLPKEAASLERPQSRLGRLPSVTKAHFPLLTKQLFVGLLKGIDVSLALAQKDPERIQVWLDVATCWDKMADMCKANKNNIYLVLFLRYTTALYHSLLTNGMKLLETNVKYQTEEVLNVIKLFQRSGRFLRDIFCTARKDKNVQLLTLIPVAKSRREKFIYRVKGMLAANNSIGAFWMGNLLNKDLDGEEIASESSEEVTTGSEAANDNTGDETASEIFNSDSDDDIDVDVD